MLTCKYINLRTGHKLLLAILIVYSICFLHFFYRMYHVEEKSTVLEDHHHDSVLNSRHFKVAPELKRLSRQRKTVSFRTEMARRKLSSDEQNLWYFLAAQLNFHSGHDKLPTVGHVVDVLQDYQRLLHEDVASFRTALDNDPTTSKEEILRILKDIESNTTRIFFLTLTELQTLADLEAIPDDVKLNIRSQHIILSALLRQLFDLTDHEAKSRYLGDKIQQNIKDLQNPRDCKTARKVLCGPCRNLKGCGLGCLMHHIFGCLATGYFSNRTVILDCEGWIYSPKGTEVAFLPLTNCSLDHIGPNRKAFKATSDLHWAMDPTIETIVLRMPIPIFVPAPEIWPPNVPKDSLDRVLSFNTHPSSWWAGQFQAWAMRLRKEIEKGVNMYTNSLDIKGIIVGIHVRRTDKLKDAGYHPLQEYMVFVEEWYDAYEYLHPGTKRKVYLASDDPGLMNEAKEMYPKYDFIHDDNISISADVKTRYSEASLMGIIKDIYSLLHCRHVVCTFSSTMCRLVYELMQATHGDTRTFQSLDKMYQIYAQDYQQGRVIQNHKQTRPEELEVRKGDILKLHANRWHHWDGYVLGTSNHNETGLVPVYKIENLIKTFNYPSRV